MLQQTSFLCDRYVVNGGKCCTVSEEKSRIHDKATTEKKEQVTH